VVLLQQLQLIPLGLDLLLQQVVMEEEPLLMEVVEKHVLQILEEGVLNPKTLEIRVGLYLQNLVVVEPEEEDHYVYSLIWDVVEQVEQEEQYVA
jgi:hypothetical protein